MKGERSPLTRSEQSSINEQNMLYKHLVLRTVLRNILRTCLITIRFSAVEKSGFVKKKQSVFIIIHEDIIYLLDQTNLLRVPL